MSRIAASPVMPWIAGAASALVRAMMDIRVVPVVSQARPSQNKTTWGPRRLPSARSLKTPMV